jgi:predicted O-linked N-acetylglucosamine transferase (SPINDLY family)
MNRKQRRIAQSQSPYKAVIHFHGKSYTIEEAGTLAIKEHQQNNLQVALEMYNLILSQISDAAIYSNRGAIMQDMKQYAEALANCDKAIALKPDFAEAYYNRGNALQEMKRYDEALASYNKSIELKPSYADAYRNRGITLQDLKRYDEALASYSKAIELKPSYADAYSNRGITLQDLKRYDEALLNYDKAIALKPDFAEAYYNRGNALQEMKRYDEALASYSKAIEWNPGYADAYSNCGITLQDLKRYDEALANFERAIILKPASAKVYNNRGNILQDQQLYNEALANFDKAIVLEPNYAKAYYSRAITLYQVKRYDEALADFNKASALMPNIPYIAGSALSTCLHLCKWEEIHQRIEKLAKGIEEGQLASAPFEVAVTELSLAHQKQCAEIYIKDKFPPHATTLWNGEHYSHNKIRIGYFSADFQNHPTAYLMAQLFELHDRSKFEVMAFSFGPLSSDPMRKRLENAFDCFIDVSTKSDLEIAILARNMEIDIAIDLKGFTQHSRTGIFALRPAPIQVGYLGYPGTMGASYIDYIIADPILIPEDHQRYYTEKIAYLPGSYQVNDSSRKISDVKYTRQEAGLPETGFVFCSFNNNYKITPDVFDVWMRLLHKVEGSVLWLYVDNPVAAKNLRYEARARGIAEHKLVFAEPMDLAEHLARHRLADLFLDTLYCNAHTTASDALWTGLPVLTCIGETFAARVAASLLYAVDLPELVTHSHAEYEALAIELAKNPEKLSSLRSKLAQNITTSSLFNTALFTKNIEAVYSQMWERNRTGDAPAHLQTQKVFL